MNERAQYFIQTLERIGAPLMAAITDASKVSGAQGVAADAQAMAMMLGKVVQASIDLGQAMDVNPVEIGDDSLRVALAGLASPLVAGQMRKSGVVPDDADVARIVGALQAVLTFSDNFTPNADNAQRLKDIEARGQSVDAHQASVQYVQAFVPVVQAISGFSFGQVPQKLIVTVSERLVSRAAEMRETLVASAEGDDQKRIELGFLNGLAQVYAACHEAETRKVSGMGEEGGAGPSLDSVWAAFDVQALMLEALTGSFVPGGRAAASGSSGGVAPVAAAAPVVSAPPPPPVAPPPVAAAPPPVETPPVEVASAQAASPLSSFVKKPAEAAAPPPPPPVSPPPVEVASVAPPVADADQAAPPAGANPMSMFAKPKADDAPAAPVAPPPVQPPAEVPVAPPPVQPAAEDEASGETGAQSGGGPMSFFKKEE